MAIITGDSKSTLGGQTPAGAYDASWNRTEPLLTAAQLVGRWLFGIPLVSQIPDPLTGEPARMSPDMLNDLIERSVTQVESMCHIEIMPTAIIEKLPWDPQEWKSNGYLRLAHRPVASVQSVDLVTSDDTVLFSFGMDWIERGQLNSGQLNILPLLLMLKGAGSTAAVAGSAQSSAYLSVFGANQWTASLIQIKYVTGWKDGLIPKIVNDLIGITTAINVLSMLAPTYGKGNSASLSIDGMSESVGNAGSEIFKTRVTDLQQLQAMFTKKIKTYVGQSIFVGNV